MLAQYALGLLPHSRIIPQSYRQAKILRISSIIAHSQEKVFTSKIINHVRVFPLCLASRSWAYLTLIMFSFIHPKRAVRLVIAL